MNIFMYGEIIITVVVIKRMYCKFFCKQTACQYCCFTLIKKRRERMNWNKKLKLKPLPIQMTPCIWGLEMVRKWVYYKGICSFSWAKNFEKLFSYFFVPNEIFYKMELLNLSTFFVRQKFWPNKDFNFS